MPVLVCFRGRYSTPQGDQWRSYKAYTKEQATIMLRNRTPWRKGWNLEEVV